MNDENLRAAWQGQPSELPTAFSPAELEQRDTASRTGYLEPGFEYQRAAVRAQLSKQGLWLLLSVAAGWAAAVVGLVVGAPPALAAALSLAMLVIGWRAWRYLTAWRVLWRLDAVGGVPGPTPALQLAAAATLVFGGAVLVVAAVKLAPGLLEDPTCAARLTRARELQSRGELEAALEQVADFGTGVCRRSIRSALPLVKELLPRVAAAARSDCVSAAAGQRWAEARSRCELYARYACQKATFSFELEPPPGKHLVIEGPLGVDGWRPSDEALAAFYLARSRVEPAGTRWRCPDLPVINVAWGWW